MVDESLMLDVNGIRMHVTATGQGPAVLLLHGFPDTHAVWRKQVGVLAAAGYRVLAPDLRGYGRTDAPSAVAAYTLDKLRADVLALLDALKIDKVRLVGHDWGGIIAWQLAALAPQRLECLVVLSTGHPTAIARAGLLQRLRMTYVLGFVMPGIAEHTLRAGDWFLMRQFTGEPGQAEHWKRALSAPGRLSAALNYYRANLGLALPHGYPRVRVPVMGIWSEHDPALGEKQMRDSAHYVEGEFRFERVRDADHWLQLTAHEQVNRLLLDFLGARASVHSAAA
ncbi:alpha/beta fold hydrolase [Massilia forsythiae]|uniref:Alpha/beta fold hydrolase n=1 Tax=Massilia forsythiae TaxID=2728020 RepID=A0A7Z2ZSA2_9BURK|nr:alpha/beta fold hydrolase [Massilia forsythiae]QJD99979.1 alpha/beta fold hydrolase [Massilia forsythiae]